MESQSSLCPVPPDQQPLQEYESLKQSWFAGWATLAGSVYWRRTGVVWGMSWLVSGPIAAASFAPMHNPWAFFFCGAGGANFLLLLVLLRLYSGWSYVGDRLYRAVIPYEESGWYDGQQWTKPPEVLSRDRLILTYQVKPVLLRLQWTIGTIFFMVVAGGTVWGLMSSS